MVSPQVGPWSAKTSPDDLTGSEFQPLSTVELPPHEEARELSRVPQEDEDEMGGPHGGTSGRGSGSGSRKGAGPQEFTFTGALPHLEGVQGNGTGTWNGPRVRAGIQTSFGSSVRAGAQRYSGDSRDLQGLLGAQGVLRVTSESGRTGVLVLTTGPGP